MTVADLIHLLQQHDQGARVMLWDQLASADQAVSMLGTGEVQSLQLGTRESVGLPAVEVWNESDEELESPYSGVVIGSGFMKTDRQALSKVLLPMTDDEIHAMSALDWLEREVAMPDSVRDYFWSMLERAIDTVLPESERAPLRGCDDVSRFREAIKTHLERRRAELGLD